MTSSIFTEQYGRFRELLVQYRHLRSITQAQLAESLSRPQFFVSKYESGERWLDIVEFLEIEIALRFDASLLGQYSAKHYLSQPLWTSGRLRLMS